MKRIHEIKERSEDTPTNSEIIKNKPGRPKSKRKLIKKNTVSSRVNLVQLALVKRSRTLSKCTRESINPIKRSRRLVY